MKRSKQHNSPSRQENSNFNFVDRISALPDDILGVILSSLPTKNAVATSILSKRWKFMWRGVDNLQFCHRGFHTEGEDLKFVEFVNRVLLLYDTRPLHLFHLFWKPRCNSFHLSSWIKTAITKNVHELLLCVETHRGPNCCSPEPIKMPLSVFNCNSLRYLELDSGISFSEGDLIFLPSLESLELISVDFDSEAVFEKLVSGCPMLHHLYLYLDIEYMIDYFGRGDDLFTYTISSTSLRCLEVCFDYNMDEPREHNFICKLKLEASSLEFLTLSGYIYEINVCKTLSSLVEAEFNMDLHNTDYEDFEVCESVVQVVRAFDCAKTLTLSADTMWAISQAEVSLSIEFKRLVKLQTGLPCCHCCVLQDFMQCSDNLQVLTINQYPSHVDRVDIHFHSEWKAPVEVPRCLSNSLKKIVVDVYHDMPDEREMIRYMLKHGNVLEVIKIKCDGKLDGVKFEVVREICKFPRKSSACEVEFDVDMSNPVVMNSNSSSSSSFDSLSDSN